MTPQFSRLVLLAKSGGGRLTDQLQSVTSQFNNRGSSSSSSMEADAPTGGAVKSLSPVVTIQGTANEADSDSSPGPRTPEPEVSPRDEGGRQGRQEPRSVRGRIRPGTGRRSASRGLNKDATDARESGRGLGGVRKESPEAESPMGAGRPAARESFLDEVGSDGDDGDGEQPSPAEEAEYGSPTRPKPPRTHFEKPSAQRMAELDRHVLHVSGFAICFWSLPCFHCQRYCRFLGGGGGGGGGLSCSG